jgi:hypothetical protein
MYMELILRDASLHLLRTQTVNVEYHVSIFDFSHAFTLQLSESKLTLLETSGLLFTTRKVVQRRLLHIQGRHMHQYQDKTNGSNRFKASTGGFWFDQG